MKKLEEGVSFSEAINKRLLIGDGAMGTMLQEMGISECPDLLNADEQKIEKVIEVYLGYLQAGSDIIQTNTFGSNPVKLKACSLEKQLTQVNSNAVEAAKTAVDRYRSASKNNRKIFIAGDVGPLGTLLEPSGNISYRQAVSFFSQQIEILADSGVDIILIETIMDINEAYAAIEAAKKTSANLPVICTLTFGPNGVTTMGNRAEDSVRLLQDKGADVVGANCSLGSGAMLDIVKKMRDSDSSAKLIFQPNAGLPVLKDGKTTYNETPLVMAENIAQYMPYNPSVIGACCGSTPQHIKKIIEAVS